jgi:hypothetical protein
MSATATPKTPLAADRAFVVQFRAATGHFAGRVEHLVSGQAAHFDSRERLLSFIEQVLAQVGSDGAR